MPGLGLALFGSVPAQPPHNRRTTAVATEAKPTLNVWLLGVLTAVVHVVYPNNRTAYIALP